MNQKKKQFKVKNNHSVFANNKIPLISAQMSFYQGKTAQKQKYMYIITNFILYKSIISILCYISTAPYIILNSSTELLHCYFVMRSENLISMVCLRLFINNILVFSDLDTNIYNINLNKM